MDKKENRRNRGPTKKETRIAEYHFVRFFVLAYLTDGTDKILMKDLYAEYRHWLPKQGHKHYRDTYLSIDSFGRIFPNVFKRKTLYINGELGKGLEGVKLVRPLEASAASNRSR